MYYLYSSTKVNVAYRWFLGLDMLDGVPHFSTFGKNYTRRFKDTDLFEQIFSHILEECMKHHLVDTSVSRTFKTLYDKLLSYHPEMMVLDAG